MAMLASGIAISVRAEDAGYETRPLLDTTADILGKPVRYPEGTPRITSGIVTIEPGEAGKLHRHMVPMYAYVIQGTVTVDYGEAGIREYRRGEAIIEAQDVPHRGMNKGDDQVVLLVVYMGAEGTPSVSLAE
jgi:quercetin dioxygenase-like cupin family protein